jgi:hypothetical protein
MTLKQDRPKEQAWKATLMEAVKEENFLRPLVEQIVQQILEAWVTLPSGEPSG